MISSGSILCNTEMLSPADKVGLLIVKFNPVDVYVEISVPLTLYRIF